MRAPVAAVESHTPSKKEHDASYTVVFVELSGSTEDPLAFHLPHLPAMYWIPVFIFFVTYVLIAVESNTGSYLDRTAAAFCGAVAMVLARVLTLGEAFQAVDWSTLIFLELLIFPSR